MLLGLLVLLCGCEGPFLIPIAEKASYPYDGALEFIEHKDTGFTPRYDHATVLLDDTLYLIGGYDSTVRGEEDCYQEDVYASTDGLSWLLIADDAPFKGRRGHGAAVLDGYIYIAGGFVVDEQTGERGYRNDLWRSSDGIEWEEVSSSCLWQPRMNHMLISSAGKLYLAGGFYNGLYYLDDMWSFDGSDWQELSCTIPGERGSMAAVTDGAGKIYLQGGTFAGPKESSSGRADDSVANWVNLWVFDPTDEAAGWRTRRVPSSGATRRAEHQLVFFEDELWLFAGKSNAGWRFSSSQETYSTERYSISGNTWTQDSAGSPFGPSYSYTTEVLPSGRLLVIGGFGSSGPTSSVWYAEGGQL